MAGYKNRTLRLDFPDLSEDGDQVYVTLKNPKQATADDLQADGTGENPTPEQMADWSRQIMARLIIDWHVYDATSDLDDMPLLDLPATAELVAKLPMEILVKINETVAGVTNPQ